jgi:mono/diheme cytochrome c family protein
MKFQNYALFPIIGLFLLISILGFAFMVDEVGAQTPNQDQLERGARIYADNCAVCHGSEGEGRVGATLAKDWPSIRPDIQVRTTIENGIENTPMIAWSQENGGPLSDEDIDALVAYILSWETGGFRDIPATSTPMPRGITTPVPGVEGDPNQGAVLYDQNCAVCHGPDGQGRIGATLAKAWPAIRPDLRVKTTISEGIENSAMPAWSQENGGPLQEGEIDDITSFVLTFGDTTLQTKPTPTPTPPLNAFLSGWGGVLIFLVITALIVGVAIWFQTRKK